MMRTALFALGAHQVSAGNCCWSKWGDASSCGNYPTGGSGPICGNDGVTVCQSNTDCDNPVPPTPPTPPPTPSPSPTPPTPTPTPTPPPTPPTPVIPGAWPDKVIGLYLLIADDDWPYKSETEWVPQLPDYMSSANVLFMAFVHPAKMPALPPAMQWIGQHRPVGTQKVIASIGGQSYSDSASWPWLASPAAAEAMAEEIIKWKTDYGIDGVDLDSEAGQSGPNMYAFAKKLKELDPTFIVTQPVFGSPQVTEENYMVNTCWADGATSPVDAIGIMVYQGTGSLQYVDNYVHGSTQWQGFPIHVDVPSKQIMLGAGGQAGAGTITTLAQAAKDQDLSGIMVWYSSVIDTATGKVGNQYSGGSMDSSIQGAESKAAWEKACEIMLGGPCNPSSAEELIA